MENTLERRVTFEMKEDAMTFKDMDDLFREKKKVNNYYSDEVKNYVQEKLKKETLYPTCLRQSDGQMPSQKLIATWQVN